MTSLTEYERNNDYNDIVFDLNDISSFLYSIGYLSREKYYNLKNKSKTQISYEISFEKNINITLTDASVKYGELLSKVNKLFNTNFTFEDIFLQYKLYTKGDINFCTYLNYLIILVYVINNYSDLLNINNLLNISKEKISILEVDSINLFQSNSINNSLEKLYNKMEESPLFKDKEINKNLIILIFFISLNNTIIINSETNNINDFISKYSLYNKIYFSNIDIGLILYIETIIFIYKYAVVNNEGIQQLGNNINNQGKIFNKINVPNTNLNEATNRNKRKTNIKGEIIDKIIRPFTSRTTVDTTKSVKKEMGELTMTDYLGTNNNLTLNNNNSINNIENIYLNDRNNIPNLYLFDNETIRFPYNPHLTIFMFQNYLKLFSFYILDKYKIILLVNLTIKNIYDLREEFVKEEINENIKKGNKNNIEEDEEEYSKDYYSSKNYKNYDFNIFDNINIKSLKYITLENFYILSSNLIYICFRSIYFNELLIKVACFDEEKKIENINNIYTDLIRKSNICYIQEPPIISYNIVDNLTINDLHLQYNILIYLLQYYSKSKNIKKSEPTLLSFKFSIFKCHINRESKIIQLYFDFSKIKEKTLFHYLKKTHKILTLEQKYENIISLLRDFKNYESKIRLTQSNFRSQQVNHLFSIMIKKIVDYLEDLKVTRISVLESKFNNFNPNMRVYIRNNKLRKKTKIEQIRKIIQTFPLYHKIKALNNFLNQLEENFDLIMLSDNYNKDFRLIRKCDENKIFFFICKEDKKVNLLEKEKQKEVNKFASTGVQPQVTKKKEKKGQKTETGYNEYLHIIFYIKSEQISFINIINFLDALIEDEQCELQNAITIICDRFYLESYVIMEQSLKSTTKKLFNIVDNYFLIAKKLKSNNINENDDKEYFNYDIFIADEYVSIANYHQYNYKKNNYSELIFEFLSCLSSCIELIIYSLRTKDIYLEKFFYILRTINDKYFIFEYKNSNIFFKKIKEFDTLLFFDPKKTEPLLCLLPKIPESDFTMSINNFYDVYLRLFLNLNKVEEQKEKLSQVFLYKIHKNIFYENYDSIILISYSYKAFNIFNDFFMKNNFLSTTKEKFINIFIVPFEKASHDKNYSELIKNQLNNSSVVKNIYIYDYGFETSSKFNNSNNYLMGYRKSEYLLDKSKELINKKQVNENENIKIILFKYFKKKKCNKKNIKNNVNNIIKLYNKNDNIIIYHLNMNDYENVLKNYQKNVYQIHTQKVDMRLQNLTEDALNNYNHLKNKQKQCNIF